MLCINLLLNWFNSWLWTLFAANSMKQWSVASISSIYYKKLTKRLTVALYINILIYVSFLLSILIFLTISWMEMWIYLSSLLIIYHLLLVVIYILLFSSIHFTSGIFWFCFRLNRLFSFIPNYPKIFRKKSFLFFIS